MKDYIKSVVDPNLTQNQNLNRVREYLQAYFLNIVYKNKFYQNLVFTGGTALRFIYRINRFSEDLDFTVPSAQPLGSELKCIVQPLIKLMK